MLGYWRKFKPRLKEEGSEVVTFCHGLNLPAADDRQREIKDVYAAGL